MKLIVFFIDKNILETILNQAIEKRELPLATNLINKGVSLSKVLENDEKNLLHEGALFNQDLMVWLLEQGANVDLVKKNIKTKTELTPLMYAAEEGHIKTVDLLLKYHADLHKNIDGRTAFVAACICGQLEMAKYLDKKGAYIDPDIFYKMALYFRSWVDKEKLNQVIEWLVNEKKIDINKKQESGDIALHCAISNSRCSLNLVNSLIKQGANVNACNAKGETPLHRAASIQGFAEQTKLLVEHGADIFIKDNNGFIPIERAMQSDFIRTREYLEEVGKERKNVESANEELFKKTYSNLFNFISNQIPVPYKTQEIVNYTEEEKTAIKNLLETAERIAREAAEPKINKPAVSIYSTGGHTFLSPAKTLPVQKDNETNITQEATNHVPR